MTNCFLFKYITMLYFVHSVELFYLCEFTFDLGLLVNEILQKKRRLLSVEKQYKLNNSSAFIVCDPFE